MEICVQWNGDVTTYLLIQAALTINYSEYICYKVCCTVTFTPAMYTSTCMRLECVRSSHRTGFLLACTLIV